MEPVDHQSGTLFFFNDTATTEIYTLSLHDALPISLPAQAGNRLGLELHRSPHARHGVHRDLRVRRSEEHTSELQSPCNLVCRLLLEKNTEYDHVAARHRNRARAR